MTTWNPEAYSDAQGKNNITRNARQYRDNDLFFLKKGTKDKRNYLVNFSKIEKKLKIKSKHNISYGIREILINRKKYISKKIKKNNFGNYVINKN